MKIRDRFAIINGDKTEFELESGGLDIIADDGRRLYSINLEGSGLQVTCGDYCTHGETLLDSRMFIRLQESNCFQLFREEVKRTENKAIEE